MAHTNELLFRVQGESFVSQAQSLHPRSKEKHIDQWSTKSIGGHVHMTNVSMWCWTEADIQTIFTERSFSEDMKIDNSAKGLSGVLRIGAFVLDASMCLCVSGSVLCMAWHGSSMHMNTIPGGFIPLFNTLHT